MLLKLSGEWKLKNDEYAITGHVPGDVTDDFLQAGIIKDPYFHDNYKQSLWITESDWVYEKTFVINENELDAYTYIKFEGVDTFSDVFLNGTLIGKTANMHRIYCFPVNGLLRDGENLLSVHLHNVFDAMGAQEQEKYESIFCANRIFVRKAQCHFGWDWAPRFPGYGIYRDVTLISEKKAATESVAVETALSGDVTFRIAFREKFVGNLEVKILHEGKCVAEKKLPVACKKMLTNLRVEKPKLWWPNGYGQQPIYEYVVCQHFEDGIQECHGIFGFRRVEIDRSVLDGDNLGFAVQVNGRKIFCRGSNWVPAECMTGRLRDEKYEQLIRSARDANFNMLRVWGGGIYEKDCFYEYCDRMGILVWQEFMFSCSEIPEDDAGFLKEITEEAVCQVKRLRNHPCLALWCGMNEIRGAFSDSVEERYSVFTLHYLLRGITAQLSPWIPYERTSPFAFADTENDKCEGDCHNNVTEPCLFDESFKGFDDVVYQQKKPWEQMRHRIQNYERYLSSTRSNFSSECAVLGMCSYDSLKKFTAPEDLRLDSDFLKERFLGNPYTYIMPTFYERQQRLAEGMYGRLENLQDLIKKANKSQADILKSEIVYCRSNDRSWGLLNWMYNDIWPTGTWSVIDYYLDKKPAYYTMKRSFAPLLLSLLRVDEDFYLCCANDAEDTLRRSVVVSAHRYDGTELSRQVVTIAVPGGGRIMQKLEKETIKGDYLLATAKDGGTPLQDIYHLSRYSGKHIGGQYTWSVQAEGEDCVVHLEAKTFVPCIKLFAGEGAVYEDNFFDMAAGQCCEIRITNATAPVEVATFEDVWNH